MKIMLCVIVGIVAAFACQAQEDSMQHLSHFRQYVPQQQLDEFNLRQQEISKVGMYTLSAWGAANVIYGAIAAPLTHGEAQAFHTSNVIWGGTNLLFSIPGVAAAYQKNKALNRTFGKTVLRQHGVEKLFLMNAAFDFLYIGAGATAWGFSDRVNSQKTRNILSGGGKSFVMQGGFLVLFDFSMYIAHSQHAFRDLNRYTSGLAFTGTGINYSLAF